jgi:hypothetical protein
LQKYCDDSLVTLDENLQELAIEFSITLTLIMKRHFTSSALFLLVTLSFQLVKAQPVLPKIIPPSPEAAAIGKFGDVQVSTYTGIPNINVPLHTINVRDISLPISLSYHAAGIKVEEEASWVGLGWALSAGFSVTRTIRGNDDLSTDTSKPGYANAGTFPAVQYPISDLNYALAVCAGGKDGQPDVFNFNFLGASGKFYIKKKALAGDPITVMLDHDNEKVSITYNESTKTWIIINKEGYKGIFDVHEFSRSIGVSVSNWQIIPTPQSGDPYSQVPPPSTGDVITAWHVSQIISPTGEVIVFEYDPTIYSTRSIPSLSESESRLASAEYVEGAPDVGNLFVLIPVKMPNTQNPLTAQGNPCINTFSYSGSYQISFPKYLKRIVFANGEVKFVTSQRDDIQEYTSGSKVRKLDSIVVKNSGLLKKINFQYSYYNANATSDLYLNKRLKLNSIYENNGSLSKKPYIFSYVGDSQFADASLPLKNSAARDYWGFYNGRTENNSARFGGPTLIPTYGYAGGDGVIYNVIGANRNSDESSTKQGVLNKIIYPTGGSSEFQFELNSFPVSQSLELPITRSYFMTANNQNNVFELTKPAEVTINASIKCSTLLCYPGAGTACTLPLAYYNNYYFRLTNLTTGVVEQTGKYSDYLCKLENNCEVGVQSNYCGIQRTVSKTLPIGKYLIEAMPLNIPSGSSYNVDVNLIYKTDLVASTQFSTETYYGGGLRVSKTIDYDGVQVANNIVRKYQYQTKDEQGILKSSGKLMNIPTHSYPEIADLKAGSSTARCILIKSTSYSNVPLGGSAQGSPVGYDEVRIVYGESGENGTSVYSFMNDPDFSTIPNLGRKGEAPFLPNAPTQSFSSSNGLVKSEVHYSRDGLKVREVFNEYLKEYTGDVLNALYTFSSNGCGQSQGSTAYNFYSEKAKWWKLIKKTEKTYDLTDALNLKSSSTITEFLYGSNHKQLKETWTTNSLGEIVRERIKYPIDLAPSNPEMWDPTNPNFKHMPGTVLVKEIFLTKPGQSEKLISGNKNNYSYHADKGLVLLNSTEYSAAGGSYETGIQITKYDSKGNVLDVSRDNNVKMAYLWSYYGTLPVAESSNATSDKIYYESFELVAGATTNSVAAHSGKKYMATSYAIPFNPPAGTYELSYWSYNGANWIITKQPYTGPITITASRIDDIRVYPVGAMMTTYNYDPLVGVITAIDHNNNATHYTYDQLQRLAVVKDLNLQPVTQFKYQYKVN